MVSMIATHWWQPSNPGKALPGVLIEEEDHGWVINVDGSFRELELAVLESSGKPVQIPIDVPDTVPILLGTTSSGELVSLIDCQYLEGTLPFITSRGSLKLSPTTVVRGVHFESLEDFRLQALSVRYSHVDIWAATSGFSMEMTPEFLPITVTYTQPKSVTSAISDDLTFSVEFSASFPSLPPKTIVHMLQQSWLSIASKAGPLKWTPLSRPILARNKLASDGSKSVCFGAASASKSPVAIPALEAALGSHPCGALSSVRVPPV